MDMVHARGERSIFRCQPNLAGAMVFHTDNPVSCIECIMLEP